jgi:hypothetical protein
MPDHEFENISLNYYGTVRLGGLHYSIVIVNLSKHEHFRRYSTNCSTAQRTCTLNILTVWLYYVMSYRNSFYFL